MKNPYASCRDYETPRLRLRRVCIEDAPALLACYGDRRAVALMNADNCTSDFLYRTQAEMEACIAFWMAECEQGAYVRLTVLDRETSEAVGTVEVFGGESGVLRIDLRRDYERRDVVAEILELAKSRFLDDFDACRLLTKAVPAAKERRAALRASGFREIESFKGYGDYFAFGTDVQKGMAFCGLCCFLCGENAACGGCKAEGCKDGASCAIRACCLARGLDGCWACAEFPCGEPMLGKMRVRAFCRFARERGERALIGCLARGARHGVRYHEMGKLTGDYDACADEQAVFRLLEEPDEARRDR